MNREAQAPYCGMTDRYLLGELSDTERELFEEHFFDCPSCSAEIQAAELMIRELETRAAPVRVDRFQWIRDWWRPVQWVPVAAGLAVSGWFGTQNWQLRHAPALVSQTATVVMPAARGGGVAVHVPRNAIRFKVDLDLQSPVDGARLELRDVRGKAVEPPIRVTASERVRLELSLANYPDGPYEAVLNGTGVRYRFEVKRQAP